MKRKRFSIYKRNVQIILCIAFAFATNLATYILTNIFEPSIARTICVCILGTISTLITLAPLFYFVTFGSQNQTIKQFMVILFNALFTKRILELKDNGQINCCSYRITYYKFYSGKSYWFKLYCKIKNKFIKDSSRKFEIGCNYLICKYRYGIEDGTYVTKKTTKSYKLSEDNDNIRGVTGRIFINDESTYFCIDNDSVNTVIQKIKSGKNDNLRLFDPEYSNKSLSENIEHMISFLQDYNSVNCENAVSDAEKDIIIEFMKKTHTDFNDMFDINNGIHANHFLGFKVYNTLHTPIGVFTIDAKDPYDEKFEKIVTDIDLKTQNGFVNGILEIFSRLTSKSVADLYLEEENRDGTRVGD